MKFSFYRNLTWIIGLLVAIEIFLKIGLHRGLVFMVADLIIVLILTFLFHQLRTSGVSSGAFGPDQAVTVTPEAESKWQARHDRWWRRHQQLVKTQGSTASKAAHHGDRSSDSHPVSSAVDVDQLERSNRNLKHRIDHLTHEISLMHDDQAQREPTYRDSAWYRQIKRMKRQIAKLKSEYR